MKYQVLYVTGAELEELAAIYERRGLTPELAHQVAQQLVINDVLGTCNSLNFDHRAFIRGYRLKG